VCVNVLQQENYKTRSVLEEIMLIYNAETRAILCALTIAQLD